MLISFFLILVLPLPLPLRLSLFCPYLCLCLCLCLCLRVYHCRPEFVSSRLCQLLALYLFPTRVRVLPSSPTLPSLSLCTQHTNQQQVQRRSNKQRCMPQVCERISESITPMDNCIGMQQFESPKNQTHKVRFCAQLCV